MRYHIQHRLRCLRQGLPYSAPLTPHSPRGPSTSVSTTAAESCSSAGAAAAASTTAPSATLGANSSVAAAVASAFASICAPNLATASVTPATMLRSTAHRTSSSSLARPLSAPSSGRAVRASASHTPALKVQEMSPSLQHPAVSTAWVVPHCCSCSSSNLAPGSASAAYASTYSRHLAAQTSQAHPPASADTVIRPAAGTQRSASASRESRNKAKATVEPQSNATGTSRKQTSAVSKRLKKHDQSSYAGYAAAELLPADQPVTLEGMRAQRGSGSEPMRQTSTSTSLQDLAYPTAL